MGWIYTGILLLAVLFSIRSGQSMGAALAEGAQAGITLALSIGGSLCLWSGVGRLMERIGATEALSRLFAPLLLRLFPSAKKDAVLRSAITGNFCANLLGLGNAATPMGIRAAKRLAKDGSANGELCRLIVLNTASIQLIPTSVAAIRSACGAASPFDILPAVWVTSLLSAGLGVLAAVGLERVWRRG